ncbi:MAG: OpgC domain-containing protein [Geminicoccaceae bacterium]
MPPPAAVSPRKLGRLEAIDGMRGLSLAMMVLGHIGLSGGMLLSRLHLGELGFVQSAQGFFFVSGLLVGLIHIRPYAEGNGQLARGRLLRRALTLYAWNLGLLIAVLLLAKLVPLSWAVYQWWLEDLAEPEKPSAVLAALMLYQPVYLDILPQYVLFLLASPLVLAWVADGRWALALTLSGACWLLVQLGAHQLVQAPVVDALRTIDPEYMPKGAFNPLAWQIVFVTGLVAGAMVRLGQLDPARLFRPERTELVVLSLVLLAAFAGWRLLFNAGLMPDELVERLKVLEHRREFGVVCLLNFAAFGWLVAWSLVAGPRSPHAAARQFAAFLHWLFARPFFVLLGRHALPVFAFHVVLVYAIRPFDWWYGPFPEPMASLIGLAVVVSLALPAVLAEQRSAATPSPRPGRA